jgi:hypothetical protein
MVLDERTGRPLLRLRSCRHRLCKQCAPMLVGRHRRRLRALVTERFEYDPTLVTLTCAHCPTDSVIVLADRVVGAFARIRRVKAWKATVAGGYFVVEFAGAGGRHVHIHAVVDADRVDQVALSKAWNRALRPPGVSVHVADTAPTGAVHVERVSDRDALVAYLPKAVAADVFDPVELPAVMRWMAEHRMVGCFGHLHGTTVRDPERSHQTAPSSVELARGINAATGLHVPKEAIVWQFSRRAAALASDAPAPRHGRSAAETLPDDQPELGGATTSPTSPAAIGSSAPWTGGGRGAS